MADTILQGLHLKILWLANQIEGHGPDQWRSDLASSRYRAILPARALIEAGHVVTLSSLSNWQASADTLGQSDHPEFIVVGKILPADHTDAYADQIKRTLDKLAHVSTQGTRVIADFCDDHFSNPIMGRPWRQLAGLSDSCVAATPEMAERVRPHAAGPVHVIGDPIGSIHAPMGVFHAGRFKGRSARLLAKLMRPRQPLKLAWYGIGNNWPAMQQWAEMLAPLRQRQPFRLDIVTRSDPAINGFIADFNQRFSPQATIVFHDWSAAIQDTVVAGADIVLVPSTIGQGDKAVKSANRVTDAIHAGKYVIASPLPAYLVYKGSVNFMDEPLKAVSYYLDDPARAQAMIRQGQALARRHFSAEVIADQWRSAFDAALAVLKTTPALRVESMTAGNVRMLVLAASAIPTYQLRFLLPFEVAAGQRRIEQILITERDLKARFGAADISDSAANWLLRQAADFGTTHLIFCRYGGPHGLRLIDWAHQVGIPTVMHIDDDLLELPSTFREGKLAFHGNSSRIENLRQLLGGVDLVHTAGRELVERLKTQAVANQFLSMRIPCAGRILRAAPAAGMPEYRIGYMGGSDHGPDFDLIVDTVAQILDSYSEVVFEVFGALSLPAALEVYGARVRVLPPVFRYEDFLVELAARHWQIGLCPLVTSAFNAVKTHIKWVEYSSVGAAVVASSGTIYDECCAEGRGGLAGTSAQWLAALAELIEDDTVRIRQVTRAQDHLRRHYQLTILQQDILSMLDLAEAIARKRQNTQIEPPDHPVLGHCEFKPAGPGSAPLLSYESLHRHHSGKVSDKWSSYFDIYDRCFAPRRQDRLALLEIGVQNGGSLELWCEYFAHGRIFVGCDIDESCGRLTFADERVRVVVGNANNDRTAAAIADICPAYDVIIDDGSHLARDIIDSFLRYFSWVKPGGVYVVEDTHTMYMHGYGGGLRAGSSAHEFFKLLVDVVNYQHWQGRSALNDLLAGFIPTASVPLFLLDGWVERVEFENSVVVIHKAGQPGHLTLGQRVVSGTVADVRDAVLVYQRDDV